MVYIYTEDKKEGKALIENAINMYLSRYKDKITVESIDGIKNLDLHVQTLTLDINDVAYYIYDDVKENKNVQLQLLNGIRSIRNSKYKKQIKLISHFCCEHSLLIADGIEAFSNEKALEFIAVLKQYKDISNITKYTKLNPLFKELYDKARKNRERTLQRMERNNGTKYTNNDIEEGVSAEKLCKEIFKIAFTSDLRISEKLGDCWVKDCCFKRNKICSMDTKNYALLGEDKQQFLVDNTIYYNIIQKIAQEQGLQMDVRNYIDMKKVQLSRVSTQLIEHYKLQEKQSIMRCKKAVIKYVKESNKERCTEDEITEYCIKLGYTEYVINKAIEIIIEDSKLEWAHHEKKALKNDLIAALGILVIGIWLKLWLGKDIVLVPEILDFMFTGLENIFFSWNF